MTMTDLVADMLTRMRNAGRNKAETVDVIHSNLNQAVADVLKREGYVNDYTLLDTHPVPYMRVYLKYGPDEEYVINSIQRESTPGKRVYAGVDDLGTVKNGLGISIVSTPHGVLSDRECRKQRTGGEVLCKVW